MLWISLLLPACLRAYLLAPWSTIIVTELVIVDVVVALKNYVVSLQNVRFVHFEWRWGG